MNSHSPAVFEGVWSANPTPFTADGQVDAQSLARLVESHVDWGCSGLFVAGTCGEGPWMTDAQRARVLALTTEASAGRLPVAMQVSDNSAVRILDNIGRAVSGGADYAVVAPPRHLFNATQANLLRLYQTVIRESPLPVILYDLGKNAPLSPDNETQAELYAEPNVVAIKDSSADEVRRDIALRARAERPALRLLNGDEFQCDRYLAAGYDGLMLGGAAIAGPLVMQLLQAARAGDGATATQLQEKLNSFLFGVYGEGIKYWLKGEKQFLVEQGIFENPHHFLGYELDETWWQGVPDLLSEASSWTGVAAG